MKLKLYVFVIIGWLISSPTLAGFLDEIADEAFDQILIKNTPGASEKAAIGRMGYHAGGDLKVRVMSATPTLLHIQAPRLSAPSCSSIDANFGAMSFISLDDAKQLLRAVVSQASTYAFGLALNSICGDCYAMMSQIANKANEFAAAAKNSCGIAKALVREGQEHVGDPAVNMISGMFGDAGAHGLPKSVQPVADFFDPNNSENFATWIGGGATGINNFITPPTCEDAGDCALSENDNATAVANALSLNAVNAPNYVYNTTWNMLSHSGVLKWFSLNDLSEEEENNMKRLLMSIIGSEFSYPDFENLDADGNVENVTPIPLPNIVYMKDLFNWEAEKLTVYECEEYGGNQAEQNSVSAEAVEALKNGCVGLGADQTLATKEINNPGKVFADRVTTLFGELIDDLVTNTGNGRGPEHKIVQAMDPFQLVAFIRNSPKAARPLLAQSIKNEYVPIIPRLILKQSLDQILREMKRTPTYLRSNMHKKKAQELIDNAEKNLKSDFAIYQDEYDKARELFNTYQRFADDKQRESSTNY